MNYSSEQLPNGRWGIYQQGKLLATIGCYHTCQEILSRLGFRKFNNSNNPKDLPSLQVTTKKLVEISDSNVSKSHISQTLSVV
jgi:hypothetical protein